MQIQNYFRGYVNSVIARDKAKFEKSPAVKKAAKKEAQAALTDDVVAQIKEHAKKDAQVNVYMQKDYIQMINAHKQQRVSPGGNFPGNLGNQQRAQGKGQRRSSLHAAGGVFHEGMGRRIGGHRRDLCSQWGNDCWL